MRIVLVAVFLATLCACQSAGPQRYVISEDVVTPLYGPEARGAYVDHYAELLCLVKKGNPNACAAAATVLPLIIRSECACHRGQADDSTAVLAIALLDGSDSFDFLDPLPTGDKEFMLKYYQDLMPVDFGDMLEDYLKKHPEIDRHRIEPAESGQNEDTTI